MARPIHEIVEEIMDDRKLTVAEVARLCDLPDSTVRGIMTRKQKSVALEVAFKLSDGLGVSLDYLNGKSDTKKSPAPAEAETEDALKEIFDKKLERALINLGLLREGEDLTPRQRIVLEIIVQLINVNFGQSANDVNRSDAVVDGQNKVG